MAKLAGKIYFSIDGQQYTVKAGVNYNLGAAKREAVSGADFSHHYKETPQVPFVEGSLFDKKDLAVTKFLELDGVTVTLELDNGKTIVYRNAWQSGEGTMNTDEGFLPFRFEAESAEEVA